MGAFGVGVMPVAKMAEWRQFCQSVANGERADTHRQYLRNHGVTREHVWLQATPMGDLALIIWEGVDQSQLEKIIGGMMHHPEGEYEKFLVNTVVREYHGMPADAPPPPPMEHIMTVEP